MALTAVVCDDDPSFRHLAARLLEGKGFRVVAEVSMAIEAIEACRMLRPDVLLLDLAMVGMPGNEAIPELEVVSPATAIVVVTSFDEASRPVLAREVHAIVDKAELTDLDSVLDLLAAA